MQNNSKMTIVTLTLAALFSALAYMVVFFIRIPLFIPSVSFLRYEPKDAVFALEALILGPVPAVLSSLVVSLIEMVTMSQTGIIGAVMNFFSTTAFILPIGIIYYRRKTLNSAVIGLLFGIFFETAAMLLWNYFISPYYMGITREAIAKILLPGFLPFNLIKSTLNAAITFLLYKPIMTVLRKANLLPKREGSGEKKSNALPIILNALCAVILLAAAVTLIVTKIIAE